MLVSNPGKGSLSFTAAPAVTGDAAFAAGVTSCGETLAAGEGCLSEVTFSPTATGTFNGMLTLTSVLAGSPHDVTLVGTAFNPVSLASTMLPKGILGKPYSYDFKQLLSVSNETSPDKSQATWEGSGTLPAGLSFNTGTGVLSGTPSAVNEGASYTVTGTYKNNQGQQVYTIKVGDAVLEAVAVAVGANHACAVTSTGGVKCWGAGSYGQLGDGRNTNSAVPTQVSGLTSGVSTIAAGSYHSCAVTVSGVAMCWGHNLNQQLGDGTTTQRATPVAVGGLGTNVQRVTVGNTHSCALMADGEVKCWGAGNNGELGDGRRVTSGTPVQVQGLGAGVQDIAAGANHTCVVTSAGAVKCWGLNGYGQLGDGTTMHRPIPVDALGFAGDARSIATSYQHTCAVTASGAVKCWGYNTVGQLGDGSTSSKSTPVTVSGIVSGASSVSAGAYNTCVRAVDGRALCWGDNTYGQLGNGTTTGSRVPVVVQGLATGVQHIMAGDLHACALTAEGAVRCWGRNNSGQLGDGTTTQRNTSVNVLP